MKLKRRSLEYTVTILYYLGFWSIANEPRTWIFYLRHLVPRFQLVRMCYSLVFQCINIYLVWGDTEHMAEYLMVVTFYTVATSALVNLFLNQIEIREIIDTIETLSDIDSVFVTYNKKFLIVSNRISRVVTKGMLLIIGVMAVLGFVGAFYESMRTKTIPFRLWFPYDVSTSPVFEITVVVTYLLTFLDSVIFSTNATLFIAFITHIVGQFYMIRYNLEHLRDIVAENIERNSRHVEMKLPLKFPEAGEYCTLNMPVQDKNYTIIDSSPRDTHRTLHHEAIEARREIVDGDVCKTEGYSCMNDGTEYGLQSQLQVIREMDHYLNRCVIHHQVLIKLVSNVQQVFQAYLTYQVFYTFACGFVVLFLTTLAESVSEKEMVVGFVLFVVILMFFLYCWICNEMTVESLRINDAAYACDWLEASEGFKRSIRIIMSRSQKPLFIKAAGVPFSRRTFKMVIKSAYYLHNLLAKLYFGEKLITR